MAYRRKILFAAAALAVAAACFFPHPRIRSLLRRERPEIRFHDGQTDSLHLNNALASYILEKGYGYRPRIVMQTTYVMQMAMENGRIDVNLEARRHEWPKWFKEQLMAKRIVTLGVIFEGSSQFFVIPKWVAEKYDIHTVFDMPQHWEVFKDPDSPSKGVFYDGPIGTGSDRINAAKFHAYGLTPYFNVVSSPSAEALEATLTRHQERRQPVFGYCWSPNAVMGAYEWYILKEPAYNEECWNSIMDALDGDQAKRIERACEYKTTHVEKIISRELLSTAPDAADMLQKMKVNRDAINETFAWMRRYNVRDWNKPTLYFLRKYEDEWKEWVTPDAFTRVTNALALAPGAASRSAGAPQQE